jgi:stage II sporulation protein P
MDNKHKQKVYNKQINKISNIVMVLLLSILATMIGVQFGDLWYKLNGNLLKKVDSENFKDTINISLPIIETIYNSGKSSVSLTGEVKEIFVRLFGFDMNSPATILNVQSPLFMSYYNREYKNEQVIPGIDDPGTGTTTKDGNNTDAGTNRYEGKQGLENGTNGQDTGEGEDKGIGQGEGMNNDQGSGEDTGKEHGKDTVPGQTADGSGQGPKSGEDAVKQEPAPQPVSSVSYEEEDENEDDSDLVASDEIVLRNFTKHTININELLKEPLNINFAKKGPKVLIYHTHTSESYVLREEDLGKKDVPSFNSNPKYNVVRVGEELARNLKKYGIETLHNGTVHDKTRDAAYGLSINTLKSYQKSYPSIKIYIDIHRDAVGSEKPKLRMVKKINGKNAAQIMFVVGSDGTLPHPEWKENLKFVLKLQKKLNEKYPGLAKPLWITGKRYNQQISNHAILIEVGGDGNLLSECLESMKYLAEVLNEVMLEE